MQRKAQAVKAKITEKMDRIKQVKASQVAEQCEKMFEGWHHSSVLANGKTVAAIIDCKKFIDKGALHKKAVDSWVCIDPGSVDVETVSYNSMVRALWTMNCDRLVGPARIRVRGSTPFCVTTVCNVERFVIAKPRLAGIAAIAADMINSSYNKRRAAARYGGRAGYAAASSHIFPYGLTVKGSKYIRHDLIHQVAHIVKLTDDIELHGSKQNTRQPRGRSALSELVQTRANAIAALVHQM